MTKKINKEKKGDTVIEVIFATTIFGLIAVISISLMNSGISTAQTAVELTLARNEIDAQAEALRFIQNGFAAERENEAATWQFDDLWDKLVEKPYKPDGTLPNFHTAQEETSNSSNYQNDGCAQAINPLDDKSFILNTRRVTLSVPAIAENNLTFGVPDNSTSTDLSERSKLPTPIKGYPETVIRRNKDQKNIEPTPLYPRLIYATNNNSDLGNASDTVGNSNETTLQEEQDNYDRLRRSEGLWVMAVESAKTTWSAIAKADLPDYYDFHIRACWYAPASAIPSTIGTVVRLYNPRVLE
jgi:hypothetical protein